MYLRQLCCICLMWLLHTIPVKAQQVQKSTESNVTRIAFGSCNNQFKAQPLWKEIVKAEPALWVWLGDNIYADTDDMQKMAGYYRHQLQRPEYQQLLKSCPVTGTWSDHDYAGDNANKNFPYKKQSQQLFLDFMGIPANDPVRQQQGIYRTYIHGKGKQRVKIILLDEVYHRDPFNRMFRLYFPNRNGDVLGEAQWAWLEKELTASDASIHIIASGLQVLSNSRAYTNWSAFPEARNRLLQLLEKTKPAIPLIISGDRHVGELSRTELRGYTYPLYEVTSSGMTHFRKASKSGNKYRVGEQVGALNFGLLQINWSEKYTSITIQIKGVDDKTYLEKTVAYPAS